MIPPWIQDDPIYKSIWVNLHDKDQNFLAIFHGKTGSGKSYSAISMAYALDRDPETFESRFNIERIVFDAQSFYKLVKMDLPKGSFIVWDEVGVGVDSRLFYSHSNIIATHVHQVFRNKNLGVIYTTPTIRNVDKKIRILYHASVRMFKPIASRKVATGRWTWIDYNEDSDNSFLKMPRDIVIENGIKQQYKIYQVDFPLPPKDLLKAYAEKKNAFNDSVYLKAEEQYIPKEKEKIPVPQGVSTNEFDYFKNLINEHPEEYFTKKNKYDPTKIAKKLGLQQSKAKALANYLQSGGRYF